MVEVSDIGYMQLFQVNIVQSLVVKYDGPPGGPCCGLAEEANSGATALIAVWTWTCGAGC